MRIVGVVCSVLLVAAVAGTATDALRVVQSLDIERYMGRWYAIASIPTTFEKQCVQGTTAEYTLLANGKVDVVNTCCDANGQPDVARGRAWIPDAEEPTKLRVSFVRFLGIWWFGAPYWVIDLANDYSFAVVGHPSRRFGWILSRTPTLSSAVLDGIVERLEQKGYSFDDFRMIDQSRHTAVDATPGTEDCP